MSNEGLRAALDKMAAAGVDQTAQDVFAHYYRQVESGETGMIPEATLAPLVDPPALDHMLTPTDLARDALDRTVLIKLNGGLGTSMGLDRAKTLLPVRDGKSFLDVIVQQVLYARHQYGARLPLLFMNSFRTEEDTLDALAPYEDLPVGDLPLSFLQNRVPKLRKDTLFPVEWPADPSLEWCPPGHGDLYTALLGTGILEHLLADGYRYASIANGDNLGSYPDPQLAGWFAASGAPFAAEICRRTHNDRKGGHLAVRKSDGRLLLRDTAMVVDGEMDMFTDIERHGWFNTNNLWFDLRAMHDTLLAHKGVLGLPLIRNVKTVDPTDPSSPEVIQIETGMGTSLEVFDGAQAIAVARTRFLPVKTTNELMIVRSDLFGMGDDGRLEPERDSIPRVWLGPAYKTVSAYAERVPVAPSLKSATSLVVEGDWIFGDDVEVVGAAHLGPEGGEVHGRIGDGASA